MRKFLLILLCLCCHRAWAQITVIGTVRDERGNGVDAVLIGVPGTQLTALSNSEGNYQLFIPSNGSYTLVFKHLSFEEFQKKIELTGGSVSLSPTLKLRTAEFGEFETSAQLDRGKPMRTIEVGDVHLNPSITGSVEALLPSRAFGVATNNELSSQYSVRGGNFDENLVYVNGIQVYRPLLIRSGQQEGLSFINGDLVSNLSFSSGGFEARYGDKLSSVLDVQYKKPERFAASATAGLLGANVHIENASRNRRFTQLHGARYYTNQYLLNSLDASGDYRPFFIDYQGYFTYAISQEWEFALLGNYSRNAYRFAPENREASFGTISQAVGLNVFFEGQEVDEYNTGFAAFTTTWKPRYNQQYRAIASVFRTIESETFDIEGFYRLSELETDLSKENFGEEAFVIGTGSYLDHARNYLDAIVSSAEIQGELSGKQHLWLWGLRYQRDDIVDKLSEWNMIDSAGFSVPNNGQEVQLFETIASNNRLATNRLMGYAQRNWNWQADSTLLRLTTGARFHYWDLNDQCTVSPRATFSIEPNWKKPWLFRASTGLFHQPAFYRELRDLYGNLNTELKAQTALHAVVGAEVDFTALGRPFKFATEAYYKYLDNLVPYELDNVRIRYYAENLAVGYATGIDLKLNGEFVKGIESWASLSVMRSAEDLLNDQYTLYFNAAGDTVVRGVTADQVVVDSSVIYPGFIPRPTDQRVNFALTFQDYLPKYEFIRMNLSLIFGTGLPTGPPTYTRYQDVFRMPPYRRVDIGFSARLKEEGDETTRFKAIKSAWLGLEVFNLLAVSNTISYLWVSDTRNLQYGVPNYLTGRRINLKLYLSF